MNLAETRAWGVARGAFWANPPRGTCPECGRDGEILHDREDLTEPVCADCYRVGCVRDREQACDVCGGGPAFRNPAHRRNEYKCVGCHAEDGYVLGDSAMLSKLARRSQPHPQGRVDACIASSVTEHKGQVKPRAGGVVMCDRHADPVKWNKERRA